MSKTGYNKSGNQGIREATYDGRLGRSIEDQEWPALEDNILVTARSNRTTWRLSRCRPNRGALCDASGQTSERRTARAIKSLLARVVTCAAPLILSTNNLTIALGIGEAHEGWIFAELWGLLSAIPKLYYISQ